jgi:prolyl-tRNA editing enzyme YbaK/EbsC (Cys-tRNA(Pro) deacylase)
VTTARIRDDRVERHSEQQTSGEMLAARHPRESTEVAATNPRACLATFENVHPNCRAVDAVLERAGIAGRVRILDEPAPTAAAAAQLVGVDVGAIANSLVFATAEDEPLLVLTSGAHRVDTAKVAALVGTTKLKRADPDFVHAHTGQRIGGVAPVAHPKPLPTLVDVALADYPQVWAAGGIPHAVFPTTFAELLALTGGRPAEVA